MRALLVVVLVMFGCGGSRAPAQQEVPHNVEAPGPDAAIDARACPNQCMDICCEADEACSHGRSPDDGTFPKCIRMHRP